MKTAFRILAVLFVAALFAGCTTTAGVNWSSDGGPSGFFGTTIQKTFGR